MRQFTPVRLRRSTRLGVIALAASAVVLSAGGTSAAPASEAARTVAPPSSEPNPTSTPPSDVDPLAPDPLDEPTVVRVASRQFIESFAPIAVGEALGEFEKENIEIEYIVGEGADLPLMLIAGQADVGALGLSAGYMNANADGNVLRLVAPNHTPNPESLSGLWVSNDLAGDATTPEELVPLLAGAEIGSSVGPGTVISWTIDEVLAQSGLSITDVTIVRAGGGAEVLIALQNGAVDAAWVLDPFWVELQDMGVAQFVAPQPPGKALGGYFMSEGMLEDQPEVAQAFLRALTRTVREHLQGDYHENAEVVAAIADALGQPPETVTAGLPLVFDQNMSLLTPEDMERLQDSFRLDGVLNYEENLPYEELVDSSILDRLIGSG